MPRITDQDKARVLKLAARKTGVTKAQASAALKSKNRGAYVLHLLRGDRKVKAVELKSLLKPKALGKAARTMTFVASRKKTKK